MLSTTHNMTLFDSILTRHQRTIDYWASKATQTPTKSNIEHLIEAHHLLAEELHANKFSALKTNQLLLSTLETIQANQEASTKTYKVAVLSITEIKDHIKKLKIQQIQTLADKTIKGEKPEFFSIKALDETYTFLLESSDHAHIREFEEELNYGQIDMQIQAQLEHLRSRCALIAANYQNLSKQTTVEEKKTLVTKSIHSLEENFKKMLQVFNDNEISSLKLYIEWSQHLYIISQLLITSENESALLQLKDEADESLFTQSAVQISEIYLKISEARAHVQQLAYQEFYKLLKIKEAHDVLLQSDYQLLLQDDLTPGLLPIYHASTNKFDNLKQKEVTKQQVNETLDLIGQLIVILSSDFKEASKGAENHAPNILKLLKKAEQIEAAYFNGFFSKKPGKAKQFEEKLKSLLRLHIQGTIDYYAKRPMDEQFVLEQIFIEQPKPRAYFNLAFDLKYLAQVIEPRYKGMSLSVAGKRSSGSFEEASSMIQQMEATVASLDSSILMQAKELNTYFQEAHNKRYSWNKYTQTEFRAKYNDFYKSTKPLVTSLIEQITALLTPDCKESGKCTLATSILKESTNFLFQTNSAAFRYLDLMMSFDPLFTLTHFHEGTLSLEQEALSSILNKVIEQYRLHIKPTLQTRVNLVSLKEMVLLPASLLESQTEDDARSGQVKKLKNQFAEILRVGYKFYNSSLSTLTSFLDWPKGDEDKLATLFFDQATKLHVKNTKKLSKLPKNRDMANHLRNITEKDLDKCRQEAAQYAETFRELLSPYRSLQTEVYKFYSAIGSSLLQNPNYLELPEITIENLELLERSMAKVDDSSKFATSEKALIENIKPHMEAIKKLVHEHKEDSLTLSENLSRYFATNQAQSGALLALEKVSVYNIKACIAICKINDQCDELEQLNPHAFDKLFSEQNSLWQKFSSAIIQLTTAKAASNLNTFLGNLELQAVNILTEDIPKDKERPELYERFKSCETFAIYTTAPNDHYLKWPLYANELKKRLKPEYLGHFGATIEADAEDLNESQRFSETFKK